jgi:hypothetical protein
VSLWACLFAVVVAEVFLNLKQNLCDFRYGAPFPHQLEALPAYTAVRICDSIRTLELNLHIDTSKLAAGEISSCVGNVSGGFSPSPSLFPMILKTLAESEMTDWGVFAVTFGWSADSASRTPY